MDLTRVQGSMRHQAFKLSRNSGIRVASPRHVACRAATTNQVEQPLWTGDALMSKIVNALIANPLLYSGMKVMARSVIKDGAEKQGVKWNAYVEQKRTQHQELEALKAELENPNIQYPGYYLQPFHSYDNGNLDWLAAYEVEPATYAMALRTYKTETLTPQQALDKLRYSVMDQLSAYIQQHQLATPAVILDVGCSVGVSARYLADHWPAATVTGMDLSPHFLAVAEQYERQRPDGRRITYVHGLAEATGLPVHSVDMMAFQFVAHECPAEVLQTFIQEARRIVKPGGILFFTDNNPKSQTIQNLPPAIATLMKSTEPHSDSYYSYDLEAGMRDAGFQHVITYATDHRHRLVVGVAA